MKRRPRAANDNDGLRRRLRLARPPWRDALFGAIAWAAAMGLSAQAALWINIAAETSHYWSLSALCFTGGLLAYPLALFAIRFISRNRPGEIAFAAAVICLSLATVSITALIFAVIYRNFYAQWHGPFPSRLWLFQLVFTTAAALYQFAVMGMRLYLPLGAIFLLAASLMLARKHRRLDERHRRFFPS